MSEVFQNLLHKSSDEAFDGPSDIPVSTINLDRSLILSGNILR
uniref:Uncharacterized protein n=1 Tax=Arundo donax TaxID=35708 RepID=A0A0A8YIV6_ARUDO